METKSLEALAARFTTSATADDALVYELLAPTIKLLARGQPVAPDEVALATEKPATDVAAVFGRINGVDWDEQGHIVGIGLSLRPTPHRFETSGRTLFAWCALDTLMFPALLGTRASIESPCRGTGDPVRIEVVPSGVAAAEPASAIVSMVEPPPVADIRSAFCDNVHFFSSRAAAASWLIDHPGATLLSVEDGFRLGRLIVDRLVSLAATAA